MTATIRNRIAASAPVGRGIGFAFVPGVACLPFGGLVEDIAQ